MILVSAVLILFSCEQNRRQNHIHRGGYDRYRRREELRRYCENIEEDVIQQRSLMLFVLHAAEEQP